MKKILCIFLFAGLFCSAVSSQKHDYNWVLGYNNGSSLVDVFGGMTIDFNITPPIAKKQDRVLNFDSFGAVCSDSMGKLLFYSNGISVHNHLNELIENGDTINPGPYWAGTVQSGYASFGGFALPFPGHPNQYYWFYNALTFHDSLQDIQASPFYYALIDMNANNGKGRVLLKNQVLLEDDPGTPAACKHGNGRDWWITCYRSNVAAQVTYLLSPQGLSPAIEQAIGPPFDPFEEEYTSKSVFSPDGQTYIRHDGNAGPRIMNFDRCTGQFSNLRWLPYPEEVFSWSASFSPDSRFLYLTKPTVVWWLDLQATDISASFNTLSRYNGNYCPSPSNRTTIWLTQEAPDGKTYATNSGNCMSRLEQSQLPSLAADMNYGGFDLPRRNSYTTCHFPHYRLGISAGSPCDTLQAVAGSGSELFYHTPYTPSLSEVPAKSGTEKDYTILPMLHTTPSAEAREEKRLIGDLDKVIYERWLQRKESGNHIEIEEKK